VGFKLMKDEGAGGKDSLNLFLEQRFEGFPADRVPAVLAGMARSSRGLDLGVSWAKRGRPTSRLLSYLDPSIDVSVGDLINSYALKDTFIGLGVSHRSGVFGASRLLGKCERRVKLHVHLS